MKRKIVIVIILTFTILFHSKVIARYYEKLDKIFIKFQIAEPIIKIENMQETIKVDNFNLNTDLKEYFFIIKNYELKENNNKRVSEISFEVFIEISQDNFNFPVKYNLYECNTGNELILTDNRTEKIIVPKDKEFNNKYKLVVMWNDIKPINKNVNIEIIIKANQIEN